MVELKIANARIVLDQKIKTLNEALDIFEKNATLENRRILNNAIMDYRKEITELKRYINNLYLRS